MKKNDKIVVVLGVIILVLASIGVYYYDYEEFVEEKSEIEDFVELSGVFNEGKIPRALIVSDENPFFPLIATPVSVNYDSDCNQQVIPMLIKNMSNPSNAVIKTKNNIGIYGEEVIDGYESAKELSINFAEKYWKSSDAALVIENSKTGYGLGIVATPIASYLNIPVIVTDEIDNDITALFQDLGVEKTIICGENIKGFGSYLKFETVEEITDSIQEVLLEKFAKNNPEYDIDYIVLANPIDSFRPKVLDTYEKSFEKRTIQSTSFSQIVNTAFGMLTGKTSTTWEFKIPEDYKYALVQFEGFNHNIDNVDSMGDAATFDIGANLEDIPAALQSFEVLAGGSTSASGIPVRDQSGQIIKDKVEAETVLYDRGGVTYTVRASGNWLVDKEGEVSGRVTVKKLDSPKYEYMKGLSSIAPYVAAYHKGLVFAKESFAFAADDHVLSDDGKPCPGYFMPRRNAELVPPSNRHIQDNIVDPLNELLADLANVELTGDDRDLKILRDEYKEFPVYVSIVSGALGVPNYIYQNHIEPFGDVDGDGVDDTVYYVGGGTPSDVIYGNIDPVRYDWSNKASDRFSNNEFPYMENIVGRITGWDVQDASALMARTIFYEKLIEKLNDWKDNYGLLIGGGQDFQKPFIRYLIFGDLLGMISRGEPMKLENGYTEMLGYRTIDQVAEPLEFNSEKAMFAAAGKEGLSDDALDKIKKATFLNRLAFSKSQVKSIAGEGVVKGGEIMEKSNFLFVNGHGNQHLFGMAGNELTAAGIGGPIMKFLLQKTIVPILGGFMGPGGDLAKVGDYTTRSVTNMDLGPSFMWLESCICGKIDGVDPRVNVGQAFMHAGLNTLVASSTGSNIGGGYLEPKNAMYDNPISTKLKYLRQSKGWENGVYTEETSVPHFGFKLYTDMCTELKENDVSVGLAMREARNQYLEADKDWELWWAPPLRTDSTFNPMSFDMDSEDMYRETSSDDPKMMEAKYVTYQEYLLFGDPAFNPYEPVNEN